MPNCGGNIVRDISDEDGRFPYLEYVSRRVDWTGTLAYRTPPFALARNSITDQVDPGKQRTH